MNGSRCKYKTGWILIGILLLSQISISKCLGQIDSPSLANFKKGESFIEKGDTLQAIKLFKSSITYDRHFAEGFHRLAQIYISLGSLEERIEAQRLLDRTLSLEPRNISYLHTQLQLYLRIKVYGDVHRILKKILKIDPKDAEAHVLLGFLYEEDWFRYRHMVSHFSLGQYAKKDFTLAVEFYQKALRLNPSDCEPYFRLALLSYEVGMLDEMISFLEEGLQKTETNQSNFYLFKGLAYHKMRQFDNALDMYEKAKTFMSPDTKALFANIGLVSTPNEDSDYKDADKEGKLKMEYAFWKKRDPLFLSTVNERMLEHYGRVAYANLRFTQIRQKIPGWKTDQGKVFIRYGAPENHNRTRPSVIPVFTGSVPADLTSFLTSSSRQGNLSKSGNQKTFKPQDLDLLTLHFSNETWNYPDMNFTFEARHFSDNYTFKWGDTSDRHYLAEGNTKEFFWKPPQDHFVTFNNMIKVIPDRYNYITPEFKFPVSCTYSNFQDEAGQPILEVYQSIPEEDVWYAWNTQQADIKRGVFLFDTEWNEVQRRVVSKPFLTYNDDSILLIGWERLKMMPGRYNLAVEFWDEENDRLGRWMNEIIVEDPGKGHLAMSDILLAREIGDYKDIRELRRGGKRIVPNTLESYGLSSIIPIYFEIYSLGYSDEGNTAYRLTLSVESAEEKKGIAKVIGQIFGRKKDRVITTYEYYGNKRIEPVYQAIELEDPRPQKYLLQVEVMDLLTGVSVKKQKIFGLKEIETDFQ